ncbi:MAG: SGNH/GDSL hydrolase family protein [Acidobacteriota bacterium]|nr:SGNH/GDSL hydrolase family protein [Acidobacteriota bacterium]
MSFLSRQRPRPASTEPGPASTAAMRVLFLGSSLTYANDMPSMVQGLALAAGETLEVAMVASGGACLEDQWHGGALRRIAEGRWDVVVLQQGPSSTHENRRHLRDWTRRFAEPIARAGARPALYMVWPSADRFAWFDAVCDSYRLAAEDVGGMLMPAGEAWRAVWRRKPQAQLLKRDGVHPTPAGSFTVALSIFGMLYDRSPVGLPASIRLRKGSAQVPPADVPLLQEAAAEANEQFGMR